MQNNTGSIPMTHHGQTDLKTACTSRLTQVDKNLINWLFRQLKAIFPAWKTAVESPQMEAEMRIQWAAGLTEAGIRSSEMIEIGLRKCRAHSSPWIPSVGQFVEWCRVAREESTGFPRETEAKQALLHELTKPLGARDWGKYHPAVWWAYSQRSTMVWREMKTPVFNKEFSEVWREATRMQRDGFDFHSALPAPDRTTDVKTAPVPTGERREKLWNGFVENLFPEGLEEG